MHKIDTKKTYVLSLEPFRKDENMLNASTDLNAHIQRKSFAGGQTFYFWDSILSIGIKKTEEKIRHIIRDNNISLVFFAPNGSDYELSPEFFGGLKDEFGVRNVLWVVDDELIFDVLSKYYTQVFDAAITSDYYAVFAYQKLGIPALYFFSNFNREDFYPVAAEKDIDVSFIGDCTKADRMQYIGYLERNGISVETFGVGSKNGFVCKKDVPKIFSRSRINLSFTKIDRYTLPVWFLEDNALTNLIRQNKWRPMEIAMTNSFCLSEYSPSLNFTFRIGEDVDIFYNREDLLGKVRYYLENEDVRIRVTGRAYKKSLTLAADVFMPKLMGELCDALNSHVYAQRSPVVLKDRVFKRNHIIDLTIVMYAQLSKFNFRRAAETFSKLFQYGPGIFCGAFLKGTKVALHKAYTEHVNK